MISLEFIKKHIKNINELYAPSNDMTFCSVDLDSRSIHPQSLFIALKGEIQDGHEFVPEAIKKGASGVVISQKELFNNLSRNSQAVVYVDDTLKSMRQLADGVREEFIQVPRLAVAGSVGKTTTKEILASLLASRYSVAKTYGSENGFIGIPKTLFSYKKEDVFVLEIGIDSIGAMDEHTRLIDPTHGLISRIAVEHLDGLKDLLTVAHEELQLFSYLLHHNKKLVFNVDDPYQYEFFLTHAYEKIPHDRYIIVSKNKRKENAPSLLYEIKNDNNILLSYAPLGSKLVRVPFIAHHDYANFALASALSILMGLSFDDIEKGFTTYSHPPDRSQLENILYQGYTIRIIKDFYNASPESMRSALETAQNLRGTDRLILILGDMLELAQDSQQLHESLSTDILKINPSYVLLYGDEMKNLKSYIDTMKVKNTGSTKTHWEHFINKKDLAHFVFPKLQSNAILLIKGSHGMKLWECYHDIKDFLIRSD